MQGIAVKGEEAELTYTIPMPGDGITREGTSVLDFVQSGPFQLSYTDSSFRSSSFVTGTRLFAGEFR